MYMPDTNEVHVSRKDAEAGARWHAAEARDNGEHVSGSARAGYYRIGDHECIEISECDEPECLSDLED